MVERDGSDLFLTSGFPPAIKVDGTIHKATDTPLSTDQATMMVRSIMNDKQIKEFDATKECNFRYRPAGHRPLSRKSHFIQQGMVGAGTANASQPKYRRCEDLEFAADPERHRDEQARLVHRRRWYRLR